MGELKAIYTIWLREMLRWRRDRAGFLSSMMQPLFWLFIFGVGMGRSVRLGVSGVSYLTFLAPGVIAQNILFTAFFGGVSVLYDMEFGFLKEILVAPISRGAIVTGKVLGGATSAFIQGLIVLCLSLLLGVRYNTPLSLAASLGVMALLSMAFMALGLALASGLERAASFQRIGRFTTMPMWFLSGALWPLDQCPTWLRLLLLLNPLTYGVDALRTLLIGVNKINIALSIGVLTAFTLIMLGLGTYLFSRKEA